MRLPTGTITFLLTDIQGSSQLWETAPEAMRIALTRHDQLLREAIETHDGVVFKGVGDGMLAAFHTATDAVAAARDAQLALAAEAWPEPVRIAVRMGIHTGEAEVRDDDYFGQPLNRVARLTAIGYGGQTLISQSAEELAVDSLPDGVTLRELGLHRLKDLIRPENVYQLCHPALPDDFPPLRSLNNPEFKHNLPQQTTSFIGREREIGEVRALLTAQRLVTLTGSGGSGKTRLSLQVAADALDDFPDGVWLIELAALTDPALIAGTVAGVLGVKETGGEPILTTLREALKKRKTLLVLDNCEHLIGACAALADALLKACPDVRLLATSREALNVAGEAIYRVPSLSLPDPKAVQTIETVSQYEAARLFIERAKAYRTDFAVTDANAPALAQICFHLDGIPLALELAAARVKSLSVEEICARLDQRFRLLTGGSRTALPRQQTLRSLIDWSYDLLTEAEKILFQRLSVFSGGWTAEAAESVCAGEPLEEWEALDALLSLTDKSLVLSDERDGAARFRLLETLRQYAGDRLTEAGASGQGDLTAREVVQRRHLAYFVALAHQAEPALVESGDKGTWLDRLETEHDNLRAALRFSIGDGARAADALYLCWVVGWMWRHRGYWTEGRQWCAAALALPAPGEEALRAQALCMVGGIDIFRRDYPAAQEALAMSLTLARRAENNHSNQKTQLVALNTLGNVAFDTADFDAAQARYEEAFALQTAFGRDEMTGILLANLGGVAAARGDSASARNYQEQSLIYHRRNNDLPSVALALENLASYAIAEGELDRARQLIEESVALNRTLGNKPDLAYSLRMQSEVRLEQGEAAAARESLRECLTLAEEVGIPVLYLVALETMAGALSATDASRAARLLGAASALRGPSGLAEEELTAQNRERQTERIRAILGEAAFAAAYAEGQRLPPAEALEMAKG